MKIYQEEIEATKVVIVGNTQKTITSSMHSKMYGWSKYGGANYGLVQENKTKIWSCQTCGDKQGSDLPAYMFEFSKDEFIRICTNCQRLKLLHHVDDLQNLIDLARGKRKPWE